MDLGAVSEEDLGRTPSLCAECAPTSLHLSAAEGYLLSRVDGHTPWRVLRDIGGLSREEVDVCIESWLADGVIEMGGPARRPTPRKKAKLEPVVQPGKFDESEIDGGLELDVEVQRRILEFESRLGCPYYDLLGIAPDADARKIKKAYFKLSREFHPDRYFRRRIGAYEARLGRIFKKIMEAYELLSDPATRAEVLKAQAPTPAQAAPRSEGTGAPSRPLTPIERLRLRMPFKIPESVLEERRTRARGFFDSARTWAEHDRFLEAASSIRLAIAFAPHEDSYKQKFAEIQSSLADQRVQKLLTDFESYAEGAKVREGLALCEEALLHRPHDPELNDAAARLSIVLREIDAAHEYADRALTHSPEVGRFRRTKAQALIADGSKGHAIHELEQAIAADPHDEESRKLLDTLKTRRKATNGGNP